MAEQVGDLPDPGVAGTSTTVSPATPTPAPPPSGQQGLVEFFKEDYVAAEKTFAAACTGQPGADWCELEDRAASNAENRYQHGLRTIPFSKAALLAPPELALRKPVDVEPLPHPPGFLRRLIAAGNKLLGVVCTLGLRVVGPMVGGKGREESWRKWPKRSHYLLRDLGLSAIRNYMNHNTLQDPYAGSLVGYQNPGQLRPEWTERFRTATGAWNTDNPMEGAAGARFIWQGNELSPRRDTVHDQPNPFTVARQLLYFDGEGERPTVDFLNLLTIGWIQFMVHDWVNHRQTDGGEIRVPFPHDDPRIRKYGREYMTFRRTQPSVVDGNPFGYENEVTAWWDLSQIYGSDQVTQDRLRASDHATWMQLLARDHSARDRGEALAFDEHPKLLANGKLYVEDDQPPIDYVTGVIDSGFTRNMWVGLELFHTLFVRHHNWLCDRYAEEHPTWKSDQIFNHARLENAATMAKIHTIEWTPAVLPTEELAVGMSFNWHGMIETLRRRYEDRKPLRLVEPVHPLVGGLIGGETNNFGVPQNFSEQFVEVYRLHAAMPDVIHIRPISSAHGAISHPVPVERTRAAGSRKTMAAVGLDTVINSFGHQHMHALVNNNYPRFMSEMSVEGAPLVDLAAADIVRARERGVPRFNDFRRQLGMPAISSFNELTGCRKTLDRLVACYGAGREGVEKLDVLVGMLCDTKDRPVRGFDTTRFAIFLQAASRRLQTDPFFTEKYSERYYTKAGLERIDRVTMKKLLLLHFPALRDSGLMHVHNAFEPWGTPRDEEERRRQHPLEFIERYRERLP